MRDTIVHLSDRELAVRCDDTGPVVVLDRDGVVTEQHTMPAMSWELGPFGVDHEEIVAARDEERSRARDLLADAAKKRRLSQKTIDALLERG